MEIIGKYRQRINLDLKNSENIEQISNLENSGEIGDICNTGLDTCGYHHPSECFYVPRQGKYPCFHNIALPDLPISVIRERRFWFSP
jgi:hypothetical protein